MEQREFLEWINSEGQLSALQNFTDAVCAAQRENCYVAFIKETRDTYDQITRAEQPKINEL